MKKVMAIDPGSVESAWIIYRPGERNLFNGFGKESNQRVIDRIGEMVNNYDIVLIEKVHGFIGKYGAKQQAIGNDILDTAMVVGRLIQAAHYCSKESVLMYRRTVSAHLCPGISHPDDSDVRAALIRRLGVQGTLKAPGPLYGVVKDIFSALAVAVAYTDKNVSQVNLTPTQAEHDRLASTFGGNG